MSSDNRTHETKLEQLLKTTYLADYVVSSPKFSKGASLEKEAADFLVPFGNVTIVIQAKTRRVKPGTDVLDPTEYTRIHKRIERAVHQVATFGRAAKCPGFRMVENLRGLEVPVPESTSEQIGIVVFDLMDDVSDEILKDFDVLTGFVVESGVPIHVLSLAAFAVIAEEVDTLPELLQYLAVRRQLLERKIVMPGTREDDLITVVKTDWPTIQKCLDGEITNLMIDPGLREHALSTRAEEYARRTRARAESRVYDEVIGHLHTCLTRSHDPSDVASPDRQDEPIGPKQYVELAILLGQLRRPERIDISRRILAKMERAATDPKKFSYGLMLEPRAFELQVRAIA